MVVDEDAKAGEGGGGGFKRERERGRFKRMASEKVDRVGKRQKEKKPKTQSEREPKPDLYTCLLPNDQQDFRRLHSLINNIRPSSRDPNEQVTARNIQRGLAAKLQDLSSLFRKKQRVYMQQLQGHAIKNKDLLAASGALTLRGNDGLDELQEDLQAVSLCP